MRDSNETISTIERQRQILNLIERQQRAGVTEICERFGISEATARRDLEALASQSLIQRVHGGAVAVHDAPPEFPLLQRSAEQLEEKNRIGIKAAEMVQDGETIFLGSGTTVLEITRHLENRHELTVITNSLPVMNALVEMPKITVIALGGVLRHSELSFIGHITEQALTEVRADKVFMGIRALSLEEGLINDYLPETMTDRAILRTGREIIVVADHTKFGRSAAAYVAPLSSIHKIITDRGVSEEFVEELKLRGVKVIVC
jgi:DeoR family transcriptional regulator, aga operon transcriptional repressor